MTDRDNQNRDVLDYMGENGSISSIEAFTDLGVTRLSARIFDLRQIGYNIVSKTVPFVSRRGRKSSYARYSLGV